MRKFVDEQIELDADTFKKVEDLAVQNNATVDEVITDILEDYISEKVTQKELKKLLKTDDWRGNFYTITDEDGNYLARVSPIGD